MTLSLRRAVTGLLSFAAAEEQALLAAAGFAEPGEDPGGPERWHKMPGSCLFVPCSVVPGKRPLA